MFHGPTSTILHVTDLPFAGLVTTTSGVIVVKWYGSAHPGWVGSMGSPVYADFCASPEPPNMVAVIPVILGHCAGTTGAAATPGGACTWVGEPCGMVTGPVDGTGTDLGHQ